MAVRAFENLIIESGKSIRCIEKQIGIAKGQISSYINSNGEKTIDFIYFLRAVRFLKPEYEKDYMKTICPKFKRLQNLRIAMEYASTFLHFDLQRELIDINLGLGRENKNWAELYSIVLDFQEKKVSCDEIKDLLENFHAKYLETEIMKSILKCYIFYMKNNYKEMYKIASKIYERIGFIKNEFVRESFMSRVCDILSRCYLYFKNDVRKARYFAAGNLENEFAANRRVHSYYILALTYFFQDYEESLRYLELYRQELISLGDQNLADLVFNKDIAFLKNYWEVFDDFQTNDPSELAHFYIRKGENEKALNILNKMESLTPFQKYYKALAANDPKLLSESLADFLCSGNKFFANLPMKKLKNIETYNFFADLLYNKVGS